MALSIPKSTQAAAKRLRSEMALDFTAAFRVLRDDANSLIRKAGREEWTVKKLLKELDALTD